MWSHFCENDNIVQCSWLWHTNGIGQTLITEARELILRNSKTFSVLIEGAVASLTLSTQMGSSVICKPGLLIIFVYYNTTVSR